MQPDLLEASGFEAQGAAVREAGEGLSPQLERRTEPLRGTPDRAPRERLVTLTGEQLEPARVDALRRDLEHVGSRVGLDHSVVSERRPQPREIGAQRRRCARGGRSVPQLFDEPLRSERTAGLNRQQRQQGALSRSTERDPCIAARRFDGSEQAQLEALRASFRSHRSILGGMRCTGNRSSKRTLEIARAPCHHGRREDGHRRSRREARRPARPRRAGRGRCRRPRARRRGGNRQVDALAGRRRTRRASAGSVCSPRGPPRPSRVSPTRGSATSSGKPPPKCCRSSPRRGVGRSRRRSCSMPRTTSPRILARSRSGCTTRSSRWPHRGALLLAIDDVQWLDPASANALSFALRRLDREPIGILLARRGEAPAALEPALPGAVERLSVGPLSVGAIQGLIRDRLGLRFPRPTLLRLHDASGGNPFFALELARALDAGAPLDPAQPLPRTRLARAPRRRAAARAAGGDEDGTARRGCDRLPRARGRGRGRNRRGDARSGGRCGGGRARERRDPVHPSAARFGGDRGGNGRRASSRASVGLCCGGRPRRESTPRRCGARGRGCRDRPAIGGSGRARASPRRSVGGSGARRGGGAGHPANQGGRSPPAHHPGGTRSSRGRFGARAP